MPVPPAARELLSALAPVLARWGRWYVFGAQAVIVHGVPRLSADVDVTLALMPDDPTRFVQEMAAAGFTLRVDDEDFVRRTRIMPFIHDSTAMPLDVVLAGSGLEDEFLDRAVTVDVGGTRAPFIARADLIVAKILAGRPKDLEDATALWRLHGPPAYGPVTAVQFRTSVITIDAGSSKSVLTRKRRPSGDTS